MAKDHVLLRVMRVCLRLCYARSATKLGGPVAECDCDSICACDDFGIHNGSNEHGGIFFASMCHKLLSDPVPQPMATGGTSLGGAGVAFALTSFCSWFGSVLKAPRLCVGPWRRARSLMAQTAPT